jgi:hypothetical protein
MRRKAKVTFKALVNVVQHRFQRRRARLAALRSQ